MEVQGHFPANEIVSRGRGPKVGRTGETVGLDRLVIDFPLHMWARIRITDRDVPRLCPWLSLVQSVAVFHCVYVKTRKHVSTRATNMDTGTASVLQQYVPYSPSLSLHVNRFCNRQRFLFENGTIPYVLKVVDSQLLRLLSTTFWSIKASPWIWLWKWAKHCTTESYHWTHLVFV